MKKPGVVHQEAVINRPYTADDLRACWDFVQHDFERLLELLEWLESLPSENAAKQLASAREIRAVKQESA